MNSEYDESILNCLAEFEHSEINLSVETERILKNQKFNKDVKTVLMTCLGCLFSEKPSHGENRDEEEKTNRQEECTILYAPSVPDQPGLTVGSRLSSEHELSLCGVRRYIQAAGKAALGENVDESSSSTEVYIPQESNCSGVTSFYGKDKSMGESSITK